MNQNELKNVLSSSIKRNIREIIKSVGDKKNNFSKEKLNKT